MGNERYIREANKICGVCGDKALGYNFNAITCESCKAFFRRNAFRIEKFRCPFSNCCTINSVTRKICQKCRLDKCFEIGMKTEYIMTGEEKYLKKQIMEANKAKKRPIIGSFKGLKSKMNANAENTYLDDICSTSSGNSKTSLISSEFSNASSNDSQKIHDAEENSTSENKSNKPFNGSKVSKIDRIIDATNSKNSFIESRYSSPDLITKVSNQNSLIKKIQATPEILTRILQNQNFIIKLLSDPDVKEFVSTDPYISKLLNENNSSTRMKDNSLKLINFNEETLNRESAKFWKHRRINDDTKANVKNDFNQVIEHGLKDVLSMHVGDMNLKKILHDGIAFEFLNSSASENGLTNQALNNAEKERLNELIMANKVLSTPVDTDLSNFEDLNKLNSFIETSKESDPLILEVINLTTIPIKRLIRMSKKIQAFKNTCEEDQLALLKGSCIEMMMLRSVISYEKDGNVWKIPHSKGNTSRIRADIFRATNSNFYKAHRKFMQTFDPRWRDENVIMILSAITLFNPDRPKVIHKDVIKLEQNFYYYLLRRYLESLYSGCEAKLLFFKLIQKLSQLRDLSDEVIRIYLDVNLSKVEPLLIEILDLRL